MSKLFLHVGMPKTGTSYIQGLLNKNKILLEESSGIGVIEGSAPHELACHLIADERLKEREDIKGLRSGSYSEINRKVSEYADKFISVVISSEYFILCDKKKLFDYFYGFFDEIEIIITVRRQDKLLASGYNQDVKALSRTSDLSWSFSQAPAFNYFESCEEWSELGLNVAAIDYDEVRKKNDGLLNAFLSVLAINHPELISNLVSPTNAAANYSYSQEELYIKLAMNRIGYKGDEILEAFRKSGFNKNEFVLPVAYENIIASCYSESNRKFINKYLPNSVNSELDFSDYGVSTQKEFVWDPIAKISSILIFFIKENKNDL